MPPGKKLHASGEDYLEAVLVIQKKKGMVRSVDVSRHMEVSKPSLRKTEWIYQSALVHR